MNKYPKSDSDIDQLLEYYKENEPEKFQHTLNIIKNYEKYKNTLDTDWIKTCNTRDGEVLCDRLVELSFTKFINESGLTIEHKKNEGLDGYIPELNTWVEYKNIRLPKDKEDVFESRITQAIEEKIKKVNNDIYKKRLLRNNSPIILLFGYSRLFCNYSDVIEDYSNKIRGFEIRCLCGEPFIKNSKRKDSKIYPRYFIDKSFESNGISYDTTCISAIGFSSSIVECAQDETWSNTLCIVHNPNARNPLPIKIINSSEEYIIKTRRIENAYEITVKEIHDKL